MCTASCDFLLYLISHDESMPFLPWTNLWNLSLLAENVVRRHTSPVRHLITFHGLKMFITDWCIFCVQGSYVLPFPSVGWARSDRKTSRCFFGKFPVLVACSKSWYYFPRIDTMLVWSMMNSSYVVSSMIFSSFVSLFWIVSVFSAILDYMLLN